MRIGSAAEPDCLIAKQTGESWRVRPSLVQMGRVSSNASGQKARNGNAPLDRPGAYLKFKAAVLELSDDATPANVVRYLNASRALDGLDSLQGTRPMTAGALAADQGLGSNGGKHEHRLA
jgi:hypothetical protein